GLDLDLVAGCPGCLLKTLGGHVGVGDARGAGGDADELHGLTTSRVTTSTTAAASGACSRDSRNSVRMRRRARLARILRWSSPPPSGAAIRKMSVAGPSSAPQSMPPGARPNTSDGSVT